MHSVVQQLTKLQPRGTGNIGYTKQRQTQTKHNTSVLNTTSVYVTTCWYK